MSLLKQDINESFTCQNNPVFSLELHNNTRIMSWNINSDRRVEENNGYAHDIFDKFSIKERIESIIATTIEINPMIVSYSEVSGSFLETIKDLLNKHGYETANFIQITFV
jgi:hypothetical protein